MLCMQHVYTKAESSAYFAIMSKHQESNFCWQEIMCILQERCQQWIVWFKQSYWHQLWKSVQVATCKVTKADNRTELKTDNKDIDEIHGEY